MNKYGVLFSLITIFIWAAYDIVVRVGAIIWQIKPYAFVSVTLFFSALTLVLFAGRGPLGVSTLKQSHTWLIGFLKLVVNVIYIMMIIEITSTEANVLIRYAAIASLIIAIIFMGRRHSRMMFVAQIFIIIACSMVASDLDSKHMIYVMSLVGAYCFFYVIMNLAIELHPQNNAARTIRDQCRTTGFVSIVTTLIFIGVPLLIEAGVFLFFGNMPVLAPLMKYLPNAADYTHIPTLVFGMAVGVFIVSFDIYFYFLATKVEKSENFFAVTTLLPAITLLMETSMSLTGLLDISTISSLDIAAIVLLACVGVFVVVERWKVNMREVAG